MRPVTSAVALIRDVLRHGLGRLFIAVLIAYWVAAFLIDYEALGEILNVLLIACGVAVVFSYSISAIRALRNGGGSGISQLTIGIFATWFGALAVALLLWFRPLPYQDRGFGLDQLVGSMVALLVVGGFLHISAIGYDGLRQRMTSYSKWTLIVSVALAGLAAGFILGGQFWPHPMPSAPLVVPELSAELGFE